MKVNAEWEKIEAERVRDMYSKYLRMVSKERENINFTSGGRHIGLCILSILWESYCSGNIADCCRGVTMSCYLLVVSSLSYIFFSRIFSAIYKLLPS